MSWFADGQDGNGLLVNFCKFIAFCPGKLAKTEIMVQSIFENSLHIFLLVYFKHILYDKGT